MKKAAVCTPLPGDVIERLEKECEVVICGELKHGKGNVTEEQTKEECMGCEIIVLGDEVAGADTIKAWADAGMKFIGVASRTGTVLYAGKKQSRCCGILHRSDAGRVQKAGGCGYRSPYGRSSG